MELEVGNAGLEFWENQRPHGGVGEAHLAPLYFSFCTVFCNNHLIPSSFPQIPGALPWAFAGCLVDVGFTTQSRGVNAF